MKRLWLVMLIVASLALPIIPVSASTIGTPANYGIITITNNGSADASNVTTNITNLNTSALITAGFLNASANNTSIQTSAGADVAFMPGSASDPWMLFVPSSSGNSYSSDLLYTGNVTGGKLRYFPGTGGMTTPDVDSLEPSANFTIEQKGWLNTDNGTSKNLVSKSGAISTAVSSTVSGNITGTGTGTTGLSQTLVPNGAGDLTGITTLFGAATHWQSQLTNDGDTSYVASAENGGAYEYDTYAMTDGTIPAYAVIDSVVVHIVGKGSDVTSFAKSVVRLNGTNVLSSQYSMTTDYVDYSEALTRPGGGSWTVSDITSLQAGVGLFPSATQFSYSTQVYVVVNYHYPDAVATTTSVTSGEHTVTTKIDGSLFGVAVDRATYGIMPVGSNVTMNIPFWSTGKSSANFTSTDNNTFTVLPTGTTWSNATGRTLNGTSDLITVTNKAPLHIENNLTVIVWFKIPTPPADYPSLIERGDLWNAHTGYAIESNAGSSLLRVRLGDGSTSTSSNWTAYPASQFNQIAVTFTRPTGTVYLNGAFVSNFTMDALIADGNANVIMGKSSIRGTYLGVTIGEAQIYDKTLTSTEISNGYQATKWKYDGSTDNYEYGVLYNAVPANSSNFTFLQNGAMPYMEYQKIYVGGNLRQHINWQYNATAPYIFTDQSGNGNNAVPTFAISNSNAYVSASLGTFGPVTEAKGPGYSVGAGTDVYTAANITRPFSVTSNVTSFPGKDVIEAIATAGQTPSQLPWMMITGFIVITCSLLATFLTSKASRGRSGTTFVKLIVIYGLIGLFLAVQVYDFWMLALFTLPSLTAIMASRKYDPTG